MTPLQMGVAGVGVVLAGIWLWVSKIKPKLDAKKAEKEGLSGGGGIADLSGKLSGLLDGFENLHVVKAFGIVRSDLIRMTLLNMLIIIGRFVGTLAASAEKDAGVAAITTLVTLVGGAQIPAAPVATDIPAAPLASKQVL